MLILVGWTETMMNHMNDNYLHNKAVALQYS